MTDPAVEAALRVDYLAHETSDATLGAREALQPLRELHQPMELKQSVFNGEGIFIGQRVSAVPIPGVHVALRYGPSGLQH